MCLVKLPYSFERQFFGSLPKHVCVHNAGLETKIFQVGMMSKIISCVYFDLLSSPSIYQKLRDSEVWFVDLVFHQLLHIPSLKPHLPSIHYSITRYNKGSPVQRLINFPQLMKQISHIWKGVIVCELPNADKLITVVNAKI